MARFVHPHSATLSILHEHVSRAVERSFYPILDCKPVLEVRVNALEVVLFSLEADNDDGRNTGKPAISFGGVL